MTSAPSTGLLTRFVLENPWPLSVILLIAAIVSAKIALDRDDRRLLGAALGCVLAAAAVFITSWMITTPGEHAKAVVRQLVAAAEEADVLGMDALFADDASVHFGSLASTGLDRAEIGRGIETLGSIHRIQSNTTTVLRAGPVDSDTAVAELVCITTTASSYGPIPSTWLFRVERESDGSWRIRRMACIAIAGRAPNSQPW